MSDFLKGSLSDFLFAVESGSRPKGGVTVEGDIPSFGGENVTEDGQLIFYPVKKITNDFFNAMSKGILQNLDVLINKDGANTGKSTIYRNSPYTRASVNEHLFILRGKKDKLDQVYLHYLLLSPNTRKELNQKITGSAQPGLNSTFAENFPIQLPSVKEQQKIAEILTSVDEVIENTQSQINKLEDLKKATMNELLTKGIGHTEFKETEIGRIPKNWEVKPLAEVYPNIVVGYVGNVSDHYCEKLIGVPFFRTQDVRPNVFNHIPEMYVTNAFNNKNSKSQIFNGDVLIARVGANLGMVCVVENLVGVANIANVIIIKSTTRFSSRFLSLYLNSESGQIQILRGAGGGAQGVFNTSLAKDLMIPIPPADEIQKTVEAVSHLQRAGDCLQQKIRSAIGVKRSLMQDLLTGRVRVTVN
jgi:type I restriction enzyme S subunit